MADESNVAAPENALNAMIQKGSILEAFEKFYADEVCMQENSEEPCRGKAANREREKAFVDSVGQLHGIQMLGGATGPDISYSEWMMDVTFKNGQRVLMNQCVARRWKNGKVVQERFYFHKG